MRFILAFILAPVVQSQCNLLQFLTWPPGLRCFNSASHPTFKVIDILCLHVLCFRIIPGAIISIHYIVLLVKYYFDYFVLYMLPLFCYTLKMGVCICYKSNKMVLCYTFLSVTSVTSGFEADRVTLFKVLQVLHCYIV